MNKGATIGAVIKKAFEKSQCGETFMGLLNHYLCEGVNDVIAEGIYPAELTYPNNFYSRLEYYLGLQDFERDFLESIAEFLEILQAEKNAEYELEEENNGDFI